jgi:HD-GYP domain-containing protein (c-di-GMP phosphodiesterase class II)
LGAADHSEGQSSRRDDRVGPVGLAIAAARELLDLDIVCVSRLMSGSERRERQPADRETTTTLPEHVVTVPLESARGTLYGSLVCISRDRERPLDQRDAHFLHVIGRLIGAQIDRDERELDQKRGRAESAGLQALLAAVDAHDRYTGEHSRSVVELSVRVARELALRPREIEQVEQVALLHDVGKVAIPDAVLLKPGPLDEEEMEVVRRHPGTGARIVGSIAGLAHLAPAIRAGHERWDGAGYPDGLSGDSIPIPSRITAVCDAYDAMVSRRPYREPLGPKAALDEVRRHTGTQFCPRAAGALLTVMRRAPATRGVGVTSPVS